MNETQFLMAMAVAPIMSLVIVVAGYIVQNSNLNARAGEIRSEFRDLLRAELAAIRHNRDAGMQAQDRFNRPADGFVVVNDKDAWHADLS